MDIPKDIVDIVNRKKISFGFGSKLIGIGVTSKIGSINLFVIERKKSYEILTIKIGFYSEPNDYTKLIKDTYNNIETKGIMDVIFNYNEPNDTPYSCNYDYIEINNIIKLTKDMCKYKKPIRYGVTKFKCTEIPLKNGRVRLNSFDFNKESVCYKLFIYSSDNDIIEVYKTFCDKNGVECYTELIKSS